MHPIRATQIKAARAILDWSQEDLAEATGLSVATIRNIEMGSLSPRNSTMGVVCRAIEDAGLEFIQPEGVRRRIEEVTVFSDEESSDQLFADILEAVKSEDQSIYCILKSQDELIKTLGAQSKQGAQRLDKLNELTSLKCLTLEPNSMPLILPNFFFRTIQRQFAGPVSYYVYGNRYTLVIPEGNENYKFVIFQSRSLATSCRSHFETLWETAISNNISEAGIEKRRAKI